jgi:hypothetical protein
MHSIQSYHNRFCIEGLIWLGEQREALEDFYTSLMHSGSTHAGWEWMVTPWGTPEARTIYQSNSPPHTTFSAGLINIVRDMLVREDQYDTSLLHITSVLSPVWVKAGKQVSVTDLPTDFGPFSYTLTARTNGADITLSNKFRTAPRQIIAHIPFFVTASSATVDGVVQPLANNTLVFSPSAKNVAIEWSWNKYPDLSYSSAVEVFLKKEAAIKASPNAPIDYRFVYDSTYTAMLDPPYDASTENGAHSSAKKMTNFMVTSGNRTISFLYSTLNETPTDISLYDCKGARIAASVRPSGASGTENRIVWNKLATGAYTVRVNGVSLNLTKKVIVSH